MVLTTAVILAVPLSRSRTSLPEKDILRAGLGAPAQTGLSMRGVQGVTDMEHAIRSQFVGGIRGLQKIFVRPPSIGLAPPKRPSNKPMIGSTDTSARYRGQVGCCPAWHTQGSSW